MIVAHTECLCCNRKIRLDDRYGWTKEDENHRFVVCDLRNEIGTQNIEVESEDYMRKTKSESEKELVDYILSVGGAIKNIEMDAGNNSYHQFELSNGETRYWKNMSIENLRRLGFYLESEEE